MSKLDELKTKYSDLEVKLHLLGSEPKKEPAYSEWKKKTDKINDSMFKLLVKISEEEVQNALMYY